MNKKLVIIGNGGEVHIGQHLLKAAKQSGIEVRFCDVRRAYDGPRWLGMINWHLRMRRPNNLQKFSKEVVRTCRQFVPQAILSVGLAPIEYSALNEIGRLRIRRLNYLTDDPWNPNHFSKWFMRALSGYDQIFTTRKSNLDDLKNFGRVKSSYLPFAYSPETHFIQLPTTPEEKERFSCDIVFIGGADRDRVRYIDKLIMAGFKTALYGAYWDRFKRTKPFYKGYADPETMRKAISSAKVGLCLVRKANRDGHVMRSFEIPAIGGCMLAEETEEHCDIFGREGENVYYFKNPDEMINKAKILLKDENERKRVARNAYELISRGGNTYKDRFIAILEAV